MTETAPLAAPHVYRWDLDKTYLQTDFDSIGGLLRTAMQGAADKANVPGSAGLQASRPARGTCQRASGRRRDLVR